MTREKYRAALESLQKVHEMGLEVKFQGVIKRFHLPSYTKASLVPNLAGVDLDKEFDHLYKEQLDFVRAFSRVHGKNFRDHMKQLREENARLREELAKQKNL